jgi:transposase InsO family protein
MSAAGNCYDNAVAESFFATLKKELVHGCAFETRSEAYDASVTTSRITTTRNGATPPSETNPRSTSSWRMPPGSPHSHINNLSGKSGKLHWHQRRRHADARRDAALQRAGYHVLRLDAQLVLRRLSVAVECVRKELGRRRR